MFTLLTSLVTAINDLATTWADEVWPTLWHDVGKIQYRRFQFKRWRLEMGFWIKSWGLGIIVCSDGTIECHIGPFFLDCGRYPLVNNLADADMEPGPQEDFYEVEEDVERVEED